MDKNPEELMRLYNTLSNEILALSNRVEDLENKRTQFDKHIHESALQSHKDMHSLCKQIDSILNTQNIKISELQDSIQELQ